ncbi:serine/threonine-protein kinase [Streptomyces sp. NPDC127038]|uniref:serine/threonine-protein kinase n=1 Tax=Streptomyces sp. NPDC127038 TaxID=3347114 RepID=UPI00364BC3E7
MNGNSVGDLIAGRYRLQKRLGAGGQGEVWEADDTSLERKVALKSIFDIESSDDDVRNRWAQRVKREGKALAKITHENVVTVHDVFEDSGKFWIVMELASHDSLAERLKGDGPFSVPKAARVGLDIARGLNAAHAAGVIHRDVKPRNIVFRNNGCAMLTDFGIATFEDATRITQPGQAPGTLPYMAPERLKPSRKGGEAAAEKSDLWALGVTLHEMVEGERPFKGENAREVLDAVHRSPDRVLKYANGQLADVIDVLLRENPDKRPDGRWVERELQEIVDSSRAARRVRPSVAKLWVAAFALLLCCLVALAFALHPPGIFGTAEAKEPAASPEVSGNGKATYAARHPGPLRIGVKEDQPGLSERTGKGDYKGFEDDIAEAMARSLGYNPDDPKQVQFVPVTTDNRTARLAGGDVDIVLATWSIRKEKIPGISFVGPYYRSLRGLLVRKDRHFKDISDLENDRSAEVCTARTSTYVPWVKEKEMTLAKNLPATYEKCVDYLLSPKTKIYAVATDDVIIAGLAAKHPETQRLAAMDGSESYGVAIPSGNKDLQTAACSALKDVMGGGSRNSPWEKAFKDNLAPLLHSDAPNEPPLTKCPGPHGS